MTTPSPAYLRECFNYNPETGALRWQNLPHLQRAGKIAGVANSQGYIKVKINQRLFSAHRVIWAMQTGEWPQQLDHINGNPSDNRWENLREATTQENGWNRKRQIRKLPRGVKLSANGQRFIAWARMGPKTWKYLGTFDTPEAAHCAWSTATQMRCEFHKTD